MKKMLYGVMVVFLFVLSPVFVAFAASERDAAIDAQVFMPKPDGSEKDGKAVVYQLDGKAFVTSAASPVERELKVGDSIQAGDAVYTEKGANLAISFDNQKLNAVKIPADSKAVFVSIEPTDIRLEDGSVYSVVNGLAVGSTWKVSTPAAVAAVRGTVYLVRYESSTGEFYAATVNVADDGKISAIDIESVTGGKDVEIAEGKEISLKEGEAPSQEMVQDLSPEAVAEIQAFFETVKEEQQESSEAVESPAESESGGESEGMGEGEGDGMGGDDGAAPPGDEPLIFQPDPQDTMPEIFNEPGSGCDEECQAKLDHIKYCTHNSSAPGC